MNHQGNGNATIICPDWGRLAAARDASPADPHGWEEALVHLDGCASCRHAAVEADPTLIFRRLPPLAVGADEVEAMRLRVSALRGARAVAGPAAARLLPGRLAWQPVAAAAALAVAMLAGDHAPGGAPGAGAARAAASRAMPRSMPPELGAELAAQPLLEELDQPYDHVVQWNAEDVSMVLVVDERLDI
jgi:hypothetical protein